MLCRSGDCNHGLRGSNSKMELVMFTFIKVITATLQRCKARSPRSLSDSLRGQCPSPSSEGPAWSVFTFSLHLSVVTVPCVQFALRTLSTWYSFDTLEELRHSAAGSTSGFPSPRPNPRTLGAFWISSSSSDVRQTFDFSFDYCLGQRTECLDNAWI